MNGRPGSRVIRLGVADFVQAVAAGDGAVVQVKGGLVAITPGATIVLPPQPQAAAPTPAPRPAERPRPRATRSRRLLRDRSPPGDDGSPSPRSQPCMAIELPLEGRPTVRLFAESAEDEQRLVDWLLSCQELHDLGPTIFRALDEFERRAAR